MKHSILIAGIGNIFQGDDAFGVHVIRVLSAIPFPRDVRIVDFGIRSIDLAFALMDDHDLIILVDATSRGCAPGTLYTIEIEPIDIPDTGEGASLANSHGLDSVRVLAAAKSMGARFKKMFLVGCEPLVTDRDDTGEIGLSDIVNAAVPRAVETIQQLIREFEVSPIEKAEVYSHESS